MNGGKFGSNYPDNHKTITRGRGTFWASKKQVESQDEGIYIYREKRYIYN